LDVMSLPISGSRLNSADSWVIGYAGQGLEIASGPLFYSRPS
jgi:hypothetical protein